MTCIEATPRMNTAPFSTVLKLPLGWRPHYKLDRKSHVRTAFLQPLNLSNVLARTPAPKAKSLLVKEIGQVRGRVGHQAWLWEVTTKSADDDVRGVQESVTLEFHLV